MFLNLSPEFIWFIVGLLLLIGELALPAFFLLFFGVGAWFTALAVFLGIASNINIQFLIFIVISFFAILLLRHKADSFRGKKGRSNQLEQIGSMIGCHGLVTEEIKPNLFSGKIELNGTHWQAVSDIAIKKGTEVVIIGQDNLTVTVKPIF